MRLSVQIRKHKFLKISMRSRKIQLKMRSTILYVHDNLRMRKKLKNQLQSNLEKSTIHSVHDAHRAQRKRLKNRAL